MKKCITFAGVVGSSKTTIAYYLSTCLGLPIHSNDAIRGEIGVDLGYFDEEEYLKRRDERIKQIARGTDVFILDASVDRKWGSLTEMLGSSHTFFVISLDLSEDFLQKLYEGRSGVGLDRLPQLISEHQVFLKEHSDVVALHITDQDFPQRLELSRLAVERWLSE